MARAAMVTTLSVLTFLFHVAATSASTWTPATVCDDDPEVDLCDFGCPDDPEVDLCDGPAPTPAPGCADDPEMDLCDGPAPTPVPGCADDPEMDLCDGPAPTPAPTFPTGTTLIIKQSMSFISSGSSIEVEAAVLEHLAAYFGVGRSACTVSVRAARRLVEYAPAVGFLAPFRRRLSSSSSSSAQQWQVDYEISLEDPAKASEVLAAAQAISADSSDFVSRLESKFQELGLTMDASSFSVQSPTISAAEEEEGVAETTPPPGTAETQDTTASTDTLLIILLLVAVAVIGSICAAFWLHHFRRRSHKRKQEESASPAADPESPSNPREEPTGDALRVANLRGLWEYQGGNFTLESEVGAESQYSYKEIRDDGAEVTGTLNQQDSTSPCLWGRLDMDGELFGFIRVQIQGANTLTTSYKKQEKDEWGADVIASKKDDIGVDESDDNNGVVM